MFALLGPSLPVMPMATALAEVPPPPLPRPNQSPNLGSMKQSNADRAPSNLPSILDMRLNEWIQKLTDPHSGPFPNGISPKQMEMLAHAQWAAAMRAGRSVRPSWRGSNHLSALLSNEVRAGRLMRLQKACYIGCDPNVQRILAQNRGPSIFEIVCAMCRHHITPNQGVALTCKGCGMNVHAECAYNQRRVPMALMTGSKQWADSWHCLNCKRCNICGESDKKEGLLCRNCDSMEHVRCQHSFDVDLSYRFWSCSLCVKASECPRFSPTMVQQSGGAEPGNVALTIPTPENSHAGSSPTDFKRSPSIEKQMQDGNEGGLRSALLQAASYHRNQFLIDDQTEPPLGRNPVLVLEDNINRKFFGLSARSTEQESEKTPVGLKKQKPAVPSARASEANTALLASVKSWSTSQVATFFRELGHPESAAALVREEIDGAALLLMERADIFSRLGLKMGPALKTYKAIRRLQKAFSRSKTVKQPAGN